MCLYCLVQSRINDDDVYRTPRRPVMWKEPARWRCPFCPILFDGIKKNGRGSHFGGELQIKYERRCRLRESMRENSREVVIFRVGRSRSAAQFFCFCFGDIQFDCRPSSFLCLLWLLLLCNFCFTVCFDIVLWRMMDARPAVIKLLFKWFAFLHFSCCPIFVFDSAQLNAVIDVQIYLRFFEPLGRKCVSMTNNFCNFRHLNSANVLLKPNAAFPFVCRAWRRRNHHFYYFYFSIGTTRRKVARQRFFQFLFFVVFFVLTPKFRKRQTIT